MVTAETIITFTPSNESPLTEDIQVATTPNTAEALLSQVLHQFSMSWKTTLFGRICFTTQDFLQNWNTGIKRKETFKPTIIVQDKITHLSVLKVPEAPAVHIDDVYITGILRYPKNDQRRESKSNLKQY